MHYKNFPLQFFEILSTRNRTLCTHIIIKYTNEKSIDSKMIFSRNNIAFALFPSNITTKLFTCGDSEKRHDDSTKRIHYARIIEDCLLVNYAIALGS